MFTEKCLCWSLFSNKKVGLQSWNFIKKRLQQRRFPVDIEKFLRTSILNNICERLFERFPTVANNTTSNIGMEEEVLSKTTQKNTLKLSLMKKTCLFMMLLIISFFLYLHCMSQVAFLPCIIKDESNEGLF